MATLTPNRGTTSSYKSKGTGTYRDCFGLPSSQYWKVYLNNGTSYSTTPINWTLPTGGYYDGSHLYGYFSISTISSKSFWI